MEEQVISFEIAVLAKGKGFMDTIGTFKGKHYYNHKGEVDGDVTDSLGWRLKNKDRDPKDNPFDSIAAPTQSLLQCWLRETHNVFIDVETDFDVEDSVMINLTFMVDVTTMGCYLDHEEFGMFKTYEDALGAGLKGALELITT